MANSLLGSMALVLVSLLVVCSSSSVEARKRCNIQCLVADPVCGTDGVTYGCGRSEAECNGVEVAKEGPCDGNGRNLQECNIQCLVYDPVCGANGVTYACGVAEAECHHVQVVKEGPCE